MCKRTTETIIRETVLRHGTAEEHMDWARSFALPDAVFDELLENLKVDPVCLPHRFGIPFLSVGTYRIRRENPMDNNTLDFVWEELRQHANG